MNHYQDSFGAIIIFNKDTFSKEIEYNAPKYLRHFINKYTKVGDKVTITIKNKKPKRTDQQNRYYFGVYLPLIATETGETDLDRLHELFKGMFLTETISEVLGHKVRMTKSTSDLATSEFMEYIQNIEVFTGIEAPPTDNFLLPRLRNE